MLALESCTGTYILYFMYYITGGQLRPSIIPTNNFCEEEVTSGSELTDCRSKSKMNRWNYLDNESDPYEGLELRWTEGLTPT